MQTKAKKLMDELGISGLQLSYEARISQADISRYINGGRRPFPGHALRIAQALGWDGEPAELFEEVREDD